MARAGTLMGGQLLGAGQCPFWSAQPIISVNKRASSDLHSRQRPASRVTLRIVQMEDLNAELAMAELERAWAARRSDLSQRLDAAVQGAISGVLDAAGQLRQAMEQDAAGALERIRRERLALAREVGELRAERDGLGAEIAGARQRAADEAAEIGR